MTLTWGSKALFDIALGLTCRAGYTQHSGKDAPLSAIECSLQTLGGRSSSHPSGPRPLQGTIKLGRKRVFKPLSL